VLDGKKSLGNFKHRQVKMYVKETECACIFGGLRIKPLLDCHEQGNGHKIGVMEDSSLVVCYVVSISEQLLMFQINVQALIVIVSNTLPIKMHSKKSPWTAAS
jgi:hypothetical protein